MFRDRLKRYWAYIACHRTKVAGIGMGLAAGIQSGCAQYGHYLPPQWQGVLLGTAGILTFAIGLYNTFQGL